MSKKNNLITGIFVIMTIGFIAMMLVVLMQTDKISILTKHIIGNLQTQSESNRPIINLEIQRTYYYVSKNINRHIQSLPESYVKEFEGFFTKYTRNSEISHHILDKSLEKDIPVCLAFAIAWGESRFNPRAYNKNSHNNSIDRGLFQLNNAYRKTWTIEDFYNIEKNTEEGLTYFSARVKDHRVNYIAALAAYNAGTTRVRDNRTPYITLIYINKILEYEKMLEAEINDFILELEHKQ